MSDKDEKLKRDLVAQNFLDCVFDQIKHGDAAHQAWLKAKLDDLATALSLTIESAEIRGMIHGMISALKKNEE